MRVKLLSALILLFLTASLSFSQEQDGASFQTETEPQEILVTGSRVPIPVSKAGPGVTIITSRDIELMKPGSITDILRTVPGVFINESGAGKLAVLNMRGGDDGMSMIMVDGVQVFDATTTSNHFDISSIPVENIERIEIVKGPVSASMGSGAMNGAVNIITKKGSSEKPASASANFESSLWKSDFQGSASLYGGNDKINYRIGGAFSYDEGVSASKYWRATSKDPLQKSTEQDYSSMGSASVYVGLTPTDDFETSVTLNYVDKDTELDGSKKDDPNYTQRLRRVFALWDTKYILNNFWEPSLKVFYTFQDRIYDNEPDAIWATTEHSRFRGQTVGADFQNNFYIMDELTMTAGFFYQNDQANVSDQFDKELNKYAGYLQGTVDLFDAWTTVLAVRGDKQGDIDFTPTYRISTMYDIKDIDLQLKAAFGTGFNGPTLYQLYHPSYGNEDLKPQKSMAYEAGFTNGLFGRKITWGVTWFDNYYKDLIEYDMTLSKYYTVAEAHSRGIEAEIGLFLTRYFDLRGSYTWTESKDGDGKRLLNSPVHQYKLSAAVRPLERLTVYAEVLFASSVEGSGGDKTTPYTLFNMTASYDVTEKIQIYLKGSNLTDLDYEINPGYGTKGIEVFAGMQMKI